MKRHLLQFWRGLKMVAIIFVVGTLVAGLGYGMEQGVEFLWKLVPHIGQMVIGGVVAGALVIAFIYWMGGGQEWRRHEG